MTKRLTQPEEAQPDAETSKPSRQQVKQDMIDLAKAHGYQLTIFAMGKKSGTLMPPDDFMPDTHVLIVDLVEVSK